MHHLLRPLAITGLALGLLSPAHARSSMPEKDPHSVSWTTNKGKTKCVTKSTKEKADKCAELLRRYNFTGVQVMAGKCNAK